MTKHGTGTEGSNGTSGILKLRRSIGHPSQDMELIGVGQEYFIITFEGKTSEWYDGCLLTLGEAAEEILPRSINPICLHYEVWTQGDP